MPVFAHDLGHGDPGVSYSMLLAADAPGAIVAGFAARDAAACCRPRRGTAIMLAMLWATALAGFALIQSYPVALALLFVAGFFELSFNAMAQTLVQLNAPAGHARPRDRPVQHGEPRAARVQRHHRRRARRRVIGVHWSLACARS